LKTIAIIPAHGGSKRLLIKIGSCLAIIRYWCIVFLYAQANSDIIDTVYVSTDDSTIKAIALTFRPK
jgi:N-acylneuraminate cytidylyltransferase